MKHFKALVLFISVWQSTPTLGTSMSTTCGGTYDLSSLAEGDSYMFQSKNYGARRYPDNYDCSWTFELGNKCSMMKISCEDQFSINGAPPKCRGDYLEFKDGQSKKYCKDNKPDFTSSASSMKVNFHTNKNKRGVGFRCTAKCFNSDDKCACGKVKRARRIVGGKETEVNEYPWQVGLVTTGTDQPWCGGSVINEEYILTANHCTEDEDVNSFEVILGEHDYTTDTETTILRKSVLEIIDHPNADSIFSHDFTLVKINPINFMDPAWSHVRPVCLPTQDVPVGEKVTVTGWGTLSSGGQQPDTLQEVNLNVISNKQCRAQYKPILQRGFPKVKSDMICAQVPGGGKDACQSDSGGPLVWQKKNSMELHGVTSWGRGCGHRNYAGAYGRVYFVNEWIKSVTGGQASCPKNDGKPLNDA